MSHYLRRAAHSDFRNSKFIFQPRVYPFHTIQRAGWDGLRKTGWRWHAHCGQSGVESEHDEPVDRAAPVDGSLLGICGWSQVEELPHESTFSRAFAEFAEAQLGQFTHETLIRETQAGRIIGHIARDSTAIQAREDFPETSQTEARQRATKEEPIGEALVEGPDVPLAQQKPETQGADGQAQEA